MPRTENSMLDFEKLLRWENLETCDIRFLVGKDKETKEIFAHKIILFARSTVFNSMFSKRWLPLESSISPSSSLFLTTIEIPDIKPAIFQVFLQFAYTNRLTTNLTLKEMEELIYVSEKYAMTSLTKQIERFLIREMTTKNVVSFSRLANTFNLDRLKKKTLSYIARHFASLTEEVSFFDLEENTLITVISGYNPVINETELFEALEKWAKARENDTKEAGNAGDLGDTTIASGSYLS